MEEAEAGSSSPLRISATVRALSAALRGNAEHARAQSRADDGERATFLEPEKLWFKESSAKNLRNRDFLSPSTMLNTLFVEGQVPPCVLSRVLSLHGPGVLPVSEGGVVGEGLRVRVDRPAAFRLVLGRHGGQEEYLKASSQKEASVVVNCPALHPKTNAPTAQSLSLGQLRTVMLADHMGALLRRQGFLVSFCPKLAEDSDIIRFLETLGVDWPTAPASWTNENGEQSMKEELGNCLYREDETGKGRRASGGRRESDEGDGTIRVNLTRVVQEQGLMGYDPSIGTCTVQQENVSHLAQLEVAASDCAVSPTTVIHVTSCQDEFRQQQVAVLWRASGAAHTQRFLVCGPVKTPGSQLTAAQYLQLRRDQMKEASEMKYGDQVEGQSWDDLIRVMTSATVRFELLSTVHTSPVTLDVHREGSVSTKGPRGGVFVMYNCARLHTLFDGYERGVEKGLYPEIPDGSQLDFSALKEEGEWLLLFNYLVPFSELLDQSGQAVDCEGGGARLNIKTEQMCKFLVSLSKDFSSYYNRVHVLGEPLPHLFNQMFCRLYLLRALRELYHSALETLGLPPVRQL
ncbi:DALR anticodon-binding domain-containing protein 3 [Eucyclogobius newberryi]|uniref:DALR anticodon-binding domain-containing protein 3 n=1 Tax=Eucyclogobius newberryi TaxID=166745 RepID=UPI003B5C52DA